MRIAIVSFFFPPYNTAGSLRVGKTAKYLLELGHEVRVITARGQRYPVGLDLEVPPQIVTYTPWIGGGVWDHQSAGGPPSIARKLKQLIRGKWTQLWYAATFPDAYVGWLPFGLAATNRLVKSWKPDVILASSGPATSLLIAHYAARKSKTPWIADMRDLWADNYADGLSDRRRKWVQNLERKVLGSAAGHTTVSRPLAKILSEKHARPVAVITNAFDPADYPTNSSVPFDDGSVNVSYFGSIYGKRDCTPFMEALALLGERGKSVLFRYYGEAADRVQKLAEKCGVAESVTVHPGVSYRESLRLQCESDILLMLLWNDPSQQGNFPVKLFEYLGSGRPILGVGYQGDLAGKLIADSGAGVVLEEPEEIASQLRQWVDQKRLEGGIRSQNPEGVAGYTRLEQTRRLAAFIQCQSGAMVETGVSEPSPMLPACTPGPDSVPLQLELPHQPNRQNFER